MVLRESGRNVLVELAEQTNGSGGDDGRAVHQPRQAGPARPPEEKDANEEAAPSNGSRSEPRTADGIREVRRLFQSARTPPRWPMYIRQAKQFLRNVDGTFDERKYGFASLVDLMRARVSGTGCSGSNAIGSWASCACSRGVMQLADAEADNRGNLAERLRRLRWGVGPVSWP